MRFIALILFCLLLTPAAFADDAGDLAVRKDLAQQIIALSTGDAMVEQVSDASWRPFEKIIRQKNPDVSDQVIDELRAFMKQQQAEAVTEVIAPMTDFYASEFTRAELETILEFYQSDTGAKLLSISPKVMQQVMPQIIKRQQQMMPKLVELLRKTAKQKGVVI